MRALLVLLLLLFPGVLYAKAPWSEQDVKREIIWNALGVVDAIQTLNCLEQNECHELNPLLGRNPDKKTLVGVKIGGAIVHYIISDNLNSRDRRLFQITSIVIQGCVVAFNMRLRF